MKLLRFQCMRKTDFIRPGATKGKIRARKCLSSLGDAIFTTLDTDGLSYPGCSERVKSGLKLFISMGTLKMERQIKKPHKHSAKMEEKRIDAESRKELVNSFF